MRAPTLQMVTAAAMAKPSPVAASPGLLRRKCACGRPAGADGACAECAGKRLSRRRGSADARAPERAPSIVHDVLRAPGRVLDSATRAFMEPRFGHDFSQVRVHSDSQAAASAAAIGALAYTAAHHVVFGAASYAPQSAVGRALLAHELAHVAQQQPAGTSPLPERIGAADDRTEREADAAAAAVMAGGTAARLSSDGPVIRRKTPGIKKVTVHLTPPQSADLEWNGAPPATATGSDHFTVSTGKGYGDPGDPRGTCKRDCCADAATQCNPPHDQPGNVGSCCTYTGTKYWTGRPEADHNGWKFWTPIQPHYSRRGIALHQHTDVTGQPIGHGCVRMDEQNAQRIAEFSDGTNTNVTIEGKASPVGCEENRKCGAPAGGGTGASLEAEGADEALAAGVPVVPGLEGEMT